jgi:uncharacterized protein
MAGPPDASIPMSGGLAFTEIASEDPQITRRFLERVFGWRFRSVPMPAGEYLAYETPSGRGGIRRVQPKEPPSSLAYIQVEDLTGAQKRVENAGATIVLPRVDVPGMGCFFWFRIPSGPVLACWQDLPADASPEKELRT